MGRRVGARRPKTHEQTRKRPGKVVGGMRHRRETGTDLQMRKLTLSESRNSLTTMTVSG